VQTKKQKLEKDCIRQLDEQGPIKPPVGYTRDDFVKCFDDNLLKGILLQLQINEYMTTKQLEKMTLYKWRSIDKVLRSIRNRYNNVIIQNTGSEPSFKYNRQLIQYRMDKSLYKNMPLNDLYDMIFDHMCKHAISMDINSSEIYTLELLERIIKGWFTYVGSDKSYKVGNYTPDFVNEKRGIAIEFNGHNHYEPFIKEPDYETHVNNRIYKYALQGWVLFSISYKDYYSDLTQKQMENFLIKFLQKHVDRVLVDEIKKSIEDPFNYRQKIKNELIQE